MSQYLFIIGPFHTICIVVTLMMMYQGAVADDQLECTRMPLETKAAALEPDSRFKLEIEGLDQQTRQYIPHRPYPIRIYSVNNKTTFIAFTIWAREDEKYNEKNPRRPLHLSPGKLQPSDDPDNLDATFMPNCNNTVMQSDVNPKTSVKVMWIAPDKNNQCVTIHARIAIKADVWYESTGPLAMRTCEDKRKNEDMKPAENDQCAVCEEARYELIFEGIWSYNTHTKLYPKQNAAFSDIIGASHNKNYHVYKDSGYASEGLKMLVKQGNTTKMEMEILDALGSTVRTVIKATAPAETNMTTVASFRVNRDKHLISLVTSLLPSPDWFLGVYNLELCDMKNKWAEHIVLNLYPLDAGIDSGTTFDSPNKETAPPQPIAPAMIVKDQSRKEDMKPFARLRVNLVRTYYNPGCDSATPEPTEGPDEEVEEETNPPVYVPDIPKERPSQRPDRYHPPPKETEDRECEGQWEEWSVCEGPCYEGTRNGVHSRFYTYRVPGRGRRRDEDEYSITPPEGCPSMPSEIEDCTEECSDEEGEDTAPEEQAQRRVSNEPLKPGQIWSGSN